MSRLTTNIISLFLIQGSNYLLPLITIPYLIRVLGISTFGLLSFAAAIAQIFVVLTEFGFNLTATREISVNRTSQKRINEIVCGVFVLKGLLLALSALLMSFIIIGMGSKAESGLYWASFLLAVGNFLFPGWLFQGLERMPFVTFTNITSKILCVGAIFLFIKSPDDLVLAAALQSAGNVIGGLIGLILIRQVLPTFQWTFPSRTLLLDLLHGGKHVFASQVSALLVNGSHTLILGFFHGAGSVGHYAVAEKIVKAANNAQSPICNAIFPRSSALFSESTESGLAFLRKVFAWFFPLMAIGCLIIAIFAGDVVSLIAGEKSEEVILILRILAFIPCSVFLDNILGTQILLNTGHSRQFMSAILISGVSCIVFALTFVPKFGATASATAYLGSQLCVLALMGWHVRRSGLLTKKVSE